MINKSINFLVKMPFYLEKAAKLLSVNGKRVFIQLTVNIKVLIVALSGAKW